MTARSTPASLLLALLSLACGSPSETHAEHTDEVDPDCPRSIDKETFQEIHLPRLCEHTTTCYDVEDYPAERCINNLTGHFSQQTCWHPCLAGACATWVDEVEECLDPPGATDEVCLLMTRCRSDE